MRPNFIRRPGSQGSRFPTGLAGPTHAGADSVAFQTYIVMPVPISESGQTSFSISNRRRDVRSHTTGARTRTNTSRHVHRRAPRLDHRGYTHHRDDTDRASSILRRPVIPTHATSIDCGMKSHGLVDCVNRRAPLGSVAQSDKTHWTQIRSFPEVGSRSTRSHVLVDGLRHP